MLAQRLQLEMATILIAPSSGDFLLHAGKSPRLVGNNASADMMTQEAGTFSGPRS